MTTTTAPAASTLAQLTTLWGDRHSEWALARRVGERTPLLDLACVSGARPLVLAVVASALPEAGQLLVVTATNREADDLAAGLCSFLNPDVVAVFPSWETLPHERLSPRNDTVGRRLAVLRRLARSGIDTSEEAADPLRIVVAPVRAVLQPIAVGLGELTPVALVAGQERALEVVVEDLVGAAYTRTDLVERRGEFAVRGGILDVFPPTEEHPLRVEFWGDTVEEIRWFRVADQRSLEVADGGLWAPPCRELLLTDAVRERARALIPQLPGVADLLEKVAEGIAVEGMESLLPVLVDRMQTLLEVLPSGSMVIAHDPERIRLRAHDLVATSEEFLEASWSNAAAASAVTSGGAAPVDLRAILGTGSYRSVADLRVQARDAGMPWWAVTSFGSDSGEEDSGATLDLGLREAESYRGDTDRAVADLAAWIKDGWTVVAVTEGAGLARRVHEVLREHGIPARLSDGTGTPEAGVVLVTTGALGRGFLDPEGKVAVVTETDLTGTAGTPGSTKDMRRMPSRRRAQVDPLALRPGDFVVHEQHGVGRFVEMMQRTVGGATREYLVLEYAASKRGQPADRLYVPTDQLDQVTKYVGGEAPTLHRLGGSDWAQTKARARRHVKQIAADLIRLYSVRMATTGHAFAPDTPWQRELEDAFAYVETPDQLSSIDEVKADMEREVPMDRLICGDVGYGKTEIAVRAAFKAVQDGKQVAVLVPTTLLVQQHLQTFTERYAQFPVTVKALSLPVRRRGGSGRRGARRRQRGRGDRHPPAAHRQDPVQGPRPGRRRRGAALRGRAQGEAQDLAHRRRRAGDVGHPDPAHPRDGRDRHTGDVNSRNASRGAAPGPHLRRRL
jgi:transcription-repair coupling factor (superfamily II helicase)